MTAIVLLDSVNVSRSGRAVLKDVSLALDAGERVALAGANGAGKTTLLRTIVGLEKPVSGVIEILGRRCASEKDFRSARAKVAYLFQDPDDQLFSPTVIDDVMFGPLNLGLSAETARAKARTTLEMLGLGSLADRVTHRLSGGEKRLVALASVLAMDPLALLLDEPTNGLDEAHSMRLVWILKSLDTAMLIVSHDWELLGDLATRAAVLHEGRLKEAMVHRHPHAHTHVHIHAADEP